LSSFEDIKNVMPKLALFTDFNNKSIFLMPISVEKS
jgi:hypothetical protein